MAPLLFGPTDGLADPAAGLLMAASLFLLATCNPPEENDPSDGPIVETTSGRTDENDAAGEEPDTDEERSACDCRRPDSFAPVVDRVRPAVVNLYSARSPEERADADEEEAPDPDGLGDFVPNERLVESLGSGLIIDEEGFVVTNLHVVDGSADLRARLLDDRWFRAEIVGRDPKTDLALLRLDDPRDLPVAPLASSDDLRVGDWVIAIGNPLGLNSTVTVGIASGIGRSNLPMSGGLQYQDFIQTDASINPGNSGGPLVDADGKVVGINTAISAEAQGIGFAIPISMVRRIIPKLKTAGGVQRSWVGLYVDAVPEGLRGEIDIDGGGALVTEVVDGGPAAEAGIAPGDVILEVDGDPVDDVDHIAWLAGHLSVGEPVEVQLQRGNQQMTVELVAKPPPED